MADTRAEMLAYCEEWSQRAVRLYSRTCGRETNLVDYYRKPDETGPLEPWLDVVAWETMTTKARKETAAIMAESAQAQRWRQEREAELRRELLELRNSRQQLLERSEQLSKVAADLSTATLTVNSSINISANSASSEPPGQASQRNFRAMAQIFVKTRLIRCPAGPVHSCASLNTTRFSAQTHGYS